MSSVFDALQLQRIAQAIEDGCAGGGSLTVDVTGAGDMQGATAGQSGVHGLVPAPAAGDQDKVLTGAGTWETPASGGGIPDYSITITSGNYDLFDGLNYTATQDCLFTAMIACATANDYPKISINNTRIGYIWIQSTAQGIEVPFNIPLKAGDTIDISATSSGNNWTESYIVFAMS